MNRYLNLLDPKWFEDSVMCQGCHVQRAAHTHHKVFKQMGGRKGAAKIQSEDPSNKIRLCVVCHDATHLRPSTLNGFSCKVCPNVACCFYGSRLLKRPTAHLNPRW